MAKKPNYRISMGLWAFLFLKTQQMDIVSIIKFLGKKHGLGFDGVELFGKGPHPDPNNCGSTTSIALFLALLEEHGMTISGVAGDFWNQHLSFFSDTDSLESAVIKNAKWCGKGGLNTPRMRMDFIDPPSRIYGPQGIGVEGAIEVYVKRFKRFGEIAGNEGLTIVIEFEPMFGINKPRDVVRFHKALSDAGVKNVGSLYDTCHGHTVGCMGAEQIGEIDTFAKDHTNTKGEEQIGFMREIGPFVKHVNWIDTKGELHRESPNGPGTSTHDEFGAGILKFDKLFPAAEEFFTGLPEGYDWRAMDLCFNPNAREQSETCVKAMRKFNRKFPLAT